MLTWTTGDSSVDNCRFSSVPGVLFNYLGCWSLTSYVTSPFLTLALCQMKSVEDPFLICGLPICSIDSVLCLTMRFSFMKSHLSIVDHGAWVLGIHLSPVAVLSRVFPTLSSMRVSASSFILMSLDYSCVQDNKYGSIFILLQVDIQLANTICCRCFDCFPLNGFVFFINTQCP